jgi:RNA polymerase sigma-70 factor (ECF subfamily)
VRERSDPVALAAGSEEAFEDFFRTEYRAVVGLAYALSGSRAIAEDLAQEAFLAAHRNWRRVVAYDRPDAWVRRVVANLAVSAFRRRVVEARALVRITARSTPAVAELSSSHAEFWTAVRALPRRQAQVVALFYVEDLAVTEIAEILEISSGSVKKHLHEARRALARTFAAEEDER